MKPKQSYEDYLLWCEQQDAKLKVERQINYLHKYEALKDRVLTQAEKVVKRYEKKRGRKPEEFDFCHKLACDADFRHHHLLAVKFHQVVNDDEFWNKY